MGTIIDSWIKRYYARKKQQYKGSWQESYYSYLENYSIGEEWYSKRKAFCKRFLENNKYGVIRNRFMQHFYYHKFRFQMVFYGVRVKEFFTFGYYSKPLKAASQAMTKTRIFWLDQYLNDPAQMKWVGDKAVFAEFIGDELFGRKWIKGPVSFEDFLSTFENCSRIIVKPLSKYGGRGIQSYTLDKGLETVYGEIIKKYDDEFIAEEYVNQKGFMHDLNPSSLNTIRVITVRIPNTGNVHIMDSYARVGVPGTFVDNYSSGGVTYDLDLKTGTIGSGRNKTGGFNTVLKNHPGTNKSYSGLVIPHWNKILDTCKHAHTLIPAGLDFIGWDVCLSEDKVTFVEANTLPGFGRIYKEMSDTRWATIEGLLNGDIS
ncbi:MAG: sugar-transfer associated ATP-grasp domain-containing protein [Bacillota bacterium]|nr:sugar-transfer associated ATP-grasp domain-containing protein [Bacillota bacterium]